MKDQNEVYSIGVVSSICRMPIKTLRYYDSIGLITPSMKDPDTGYRYYNKEEICRLYLVKRLKEMNFSLTEIKEHLESNNIRTLAMRVEGKLAEMQEEIEAMQNRYLDCQFFLDRINKGNTILEGMQILLTPERLSEKALSVEEIPEKTVLSIRRTFNNYRNEEANVDRWGELLELVEKTNAVTTGPIAVMYHNPPLEQFFVNTCDYEVYLEIKEPIDSPCCRVIPAFKAVKTIHIGPYSELIKPYLIIMRWISDNGYEVCGDISDAFLVSPIDTGVSEEFVTEIVVPVQKREK